MTDPIVFDAYTGWVDITDANSIPTDARRITAADLLRYEQLGLDVTAFLNSLSDSYVLNSRIGQASGTASLGADGKVPAIQIPDLSGLYLPASLLGTTNGVATLDGTKHVPAAQIPDLSGTYLTPAQKVTDSQMPASYVPRWAPNTVYAANQQVVNPTNDVVSAISAHTSGATFTAANWTPSGTANRVSALEKPPYILVGKTGTQSVAISPGTAVTWDVHNRQVGITHSLGGSGFTVVTPGIYSLNAKVASNIGTGTVSVNILVNGTNQPSAVFDSDSTSTAWGKVQTIIEVPLVAGDVVTVQAIQTPAASINGPQCFFLMKLVSLT